MDNLIPIGRFSRVCRLSVKSLRNYADAGLLTPAWVDPSSGYRYYTYAQVTQAEVIRVLRTLEMPLDEIREVLFATSGDVVTKVLDRHRARLEATLDHHSRMLEFLRRLIDEEGSPMHYEVTVKEIPAQHVAVLRCRVTAQTIGDDVGKGFGTLMGAIGQSGAGFAGPPFLVMTEVVDIDGSGEGAVELGMPVTAPFPGLGDVVGEERPAELVAATLHRGRYDESGPAYRAVEQWIQEHGHATTGAPREVYLTGPEEAPDPADYLTEIQFPIVVPG
jgi:effector-binding domain-containing protein